MTLYKLTTQDGKTRKEQSNETLWGEGIGHTASGVGELCGPGWLHAYESPEIAALMNPAHAAITDPILWECDGDIGLRDGPLKCGCTRLITLRQIPLPQISTDQRVEIAIRCAMVVIDDHIPKWSAWAVGWIEGSDRTAYAAMNAADAANAAYAAAYAAYAAMNAAYAANAAMNAAMNAANAAVYAKVYAAYAAAYAANAAYAAAYAKVYAANAAMNAANTANAAYAAAYAAANAEAYAANAEAKKELYLTTIILEVLNKKVLS